MKHLVALLLLVCAGQTASANKMDEFLAGSAWCFEDTSGPWDHGRFHFEYNKWGMNAAKYDVTDAPAPGFVEYGWRTSWNLSGYYRVTLWTNSNRRIRADIEVQDNGKIMKWYWLSKGLPRSTLHRCS